METWKKFLLRIIAVLVLGFTLKLAPYAYRVSHSFHNVQTALEEQEYQSVAENLAIAAEYLPWRKPLWESAGNFAVRAEDYQLARSAFEQAEEAKTLTTEGQLALGEVYQTLGEDALAVGIWSEIDGSFDALWRTAMLLTNAGDIPSAIDSWQDALALAPPTDQTEIHYHLGMLLTAHNAANALPHLKAAASAYPEIQVLVAALEEIPDDEEPAYYQIVAGQALASLDRWTLAERAFQQAVFLRKDYAEAWAYLGEAFQHVEEEGKEPLDALQNALDINPNSLAANMFMGKYWQRQENYEEALPYFEAILNLEPELPEAYLEQAHTLAALGELSEAETIYRKVIKLAPQNAEYYRILAQFCVKYHYYVREIGLSAARQAMWLDGESAAPRDVMGLVLFELEDEFNAERLFLASLEADARYAPAHLHLGMVYLYQEEDTRAYYHLNQAVAFANSPAIMEHAQQLLGYFNP